jgi:RNA polymerase subunit RPABC4/transcription elongation factor Spt4
MLPEVVAAALAQMPSMPTFSPPPTIQLPTSSFTVQPIFLLFGAAITGVIALAIWRSKGGSPIVGFLWGFLLGIIGIIVVAVARVPGTRKVPMVATAETAAWQEAQQATVPQRPCPHCQATIPADRGTCPLCAQPSEPWRFRNGVWVTRNDGVDWWFNEQTNGWLPQRINKFCPYCRADMEPQDAVCPECGQTSSVLADPT